MQHEDPFLRSKVFHCLGAVEQEEFPTAKLFKIGLADSDFYVYEANVIANILMQPRAALNPQALLAVLQHRIALVKTQKGLPN